MTDTLRKRVQARNAHHTNIKKELKKGEEALKNRERPKLVLAEVKLRGFIDKLPELDREILDLTPSEGEEAEANESAALMSDLMDTLIKWQIALRGEPAQGNPQQSNPVNAAQPAQASSTAVHQANAESVRLPQLQLEKFCGKPDKWTEFWDSFESTIHNNPKLSKVDKFKYLKLFVEGNPLEMLRGYALTDANYDTVIEALKERFGQSETAIDAHFNALFALPAASNSTASLYSTLDQCEMHMRSLLALGVEEKEFERMVVPEIIRKMPSFIQSNLHRANAGQPWKISTLRELIKQEIKIVEMVEQSDKSNRAASNTNGFKKKQGWMGGIPEQPTNGGTTSALVNTTASKDNAVPSSLKCSFCSDNHYPDQCTKYGNLTSRQAVVDELRLCRKCLRSGHFGKNCHRPRYCVYCKKEGSHHRSLCAVKFGNEQQGTLPVKAGNGNTTMISSAVDNSEPENASGVGNAVSANSDTGNNGAPASENVHAISAMPVPGGSSIMQTAVAEVVGQKSKCTARLMFDSASSKSFVTMKVQTKIGAKTNGAKDLSISGFQDTQRRQAKYPIVSFSVVCKDGGELNMRAHVTENITCPIQKVPLSLNEFPQLCHYPLAESLVGDTELVEIDVLVGLDYYYRFISGVVQHLSDSLVLLESKVGYIVAGEHDGCSEVDSTMLILSQPFDSLPDSEPNLAKYWELEEIGIKESVDQVDEEEAMRLFRENVEFDKKRYTVKWPWKHPKTVLPSNYKGAYGQLQANLSGLAQQPSVLAHYHQTILEQRQRGIIEEAPNQNTADGVGIHYLQHHGVLKPERETTKLRVVHNASKKTRASNISLNDCLYPGPVLLEDLCGLLLRFRLYEIGLVSDIEKAFMQIQLQPSERDVTRFLWVRDIEHPAKGKNIVHYRFTRVMFGINASPFLLAATIHHHLSKYDSSIARQLEENLYVDNIIAGTSCPRQASEYYKEAKAIFEACSMNLRQFYTNNSHVRSALDDADRGTLSQPKVLGLSWNMEEDTLQCPKVRASRPGISLTKRQAAGILAHLYDPCGFFTPVSVVGKRLMQEVWQLELKWDDLLPEDLVRQWQNYFDEMMQIPEVQTHRWLAENVTDSQVQFQLHVFCDASKEAYDAAAYLRSYNNGDIRVNLIFAKGRVKPLKPITIPRLELLGVLMGVRLSKYLEKEMRLPLVEKFVWSDSMCVLQWIPKKQVLPVFIENRLKEIRSHGDITYSFVRSELNPADLGTRGCQCEFLKNNSLWWKGPPFLSRPVDEWPDSRNAAKDCYDLQDSPCIDHCEAYVVTTTRDESENLGIGKVIDLHRFSSLQKLLRVTAWFHRAFRIKSRRNGNTDCKSSLSGREIKDALLLWVKYCQQNHFAEIFSGKTHPIVRQLNAFVDGTGVVRCRGRLENAEISEEANNPILLPKNDRFTQLVIRDAHVRLRHAKVEHTLAQVRQRYWVVQGRSAVKRVVTQCRVCRRKDKQPFQLPPQPPLPKFRVDRCEPFQRVGIDYMGPLFVDNDSVGVELKKTWVCLFTCAVIRAVHLEVVMDQSTEQFILCLRRFAARYGRPDMIVSDNATNFKLASKGLKAWWAELLEDDKTQDWAANNSIEWKFVTEMSPWMGGFYEKLIGIVKNALIKTVGKRKLTVTELQTVIAEIEATVNTRPLVSSEDETHQLYLSPAHFLAPRMKEIIPTADFADTGFGDDASETQARLILSWKRTQSLLDSFWKMWQNQYLLGLRDKWSEQHQYKPSREIPCENMVVLLKDEGIPRGHWRLGRIVQLHKSFDGIVRSVTVKTEGGQLHRPLKLLVPLECGSEEQDSQMEKVKGPQKVGPTSGNENVAQSENLRPRRRAAEVAKDKIRQNLRQLKESD